MELQRSPWLTRLACVAAGAASVMPPAHAAAGQAPAQAQVDPAAPVNPNAAATAADHKNMMEQLGIKALRPGPSGTETAPNYANYDEAFADPYPQLPELLTLDSGRKVTSADV